MSNELPERPDLKRPKSPKPANLPRPAPDLNVDPIDTASTHEVASKSAHQVQPIQKIVRVPFSNRLSEETLDILAQVKADLKLPIYEAIEQAVQEKWSSYSRKK